MLTFHHEVLWLSTETNCIANTQHTILYEFINYTFKITATFPMSLTKHGIKVADILLAHLVVKTFTCILSHHILWIGAEMGFRQKHNHGNFHLYENEWNDHALAQISVKSLAIHFKSPQSLEWLLKYQFLLKAATLTVMKFMNSESP